MAFGAIDRGMRAGQGEIRQVMIESRRAPGILSMTLRAIGGETAGLMVGVLHAQVITLMAAETIPRQVVLITRVARIAAY